MYCMVVISSDNKWLLNSVVCACARVLVMEHRSSWMLSVSLFPEQHPDHWLFKCATGPHSTVRECLVRRNMDLQM